jgi:hypothetical protein
MQNMYINPALTVPPGPDGMPPNIDPRESQEHFEVRCRASGLRVVCAAAV